MDFTTTQQGLPSEKSPIQSSGRSSNELERPAPQAPAKPPRTTWENLIAPVRASSFVELQLILLTFCTGIQDAISFPDFRCFASNQTGNTIFLMVSAIIPEFNGTMFVTSNVGVAMGLFVLGAFLTGQAGHLVKNPRSRLYLIISNFIQTVLVFAAGAVQYVYGVQTEGPSTLVVIALLAFAAGSQVVQARALAMTEISTAMATAAWVDIMVDPHLFAFANRSRNRRLMFLLSLVLGALFGALLWQKVGSAAAVVVSGAGKMLVTVLYFACPVETGEKAEKTQSAGQWAPEGRWVTEQV